MVFTKLLPKVIQNNKKKKTPFYINVSLDLKISCNREVWEAWRTPGVELSDLCV